MLFAYCYDGIPYRQQIHSPHFTHCYVPMKVAHVLRHNRQLIAAAVHAVCDRDVIDMKVCTITMPLLSWVSTIQACRKMTAFPVDKCIMTGVCVHVRVCACVCILV